MSAELILIGIVACVAAAPLSAITGRDYLRASRVQEWLDLHPRHKRLSLTRRECRRLAHDPELNAAYDLLAGLFDHSRVGNAVLMQGALPFRLEMPPSLIFLGSGPVGERLRAGEHTGAR